MTNKKTILTGIIIFALILTIGYFLKPDSNDLRDHGNTDKVTMQKLAVD